MSMNHAEFDQRKFPSSPRSRVCHIPRAGVKDKCDRKPVPEDPTEGIALHNISMHSCISGEELEGINPLANETCSTVPLCVCLYCGRSFLSEKLIIHNKSCTAGNPGRPVNKSFERGLVEECVRPVEKVIQPRWGSTRISNQKISRCESDCGATRTKIPLGNRNSTRLRHPVSSQSRSPSPQPNSGSVSEKSYRDYNTDTKECTTREQSDSESCSQLYSQTTCMDYEESKDASENFKTRKDSICTDSSMSKDSALINLPDRVDEMEFTVALMADTINEMKLIVADLHAMKVQASTAAKKKEKQKEKEKNCSIC